MEFLALAGRKDENCDDEDLEHDQPGDERRKPEERETEWVITLLMCLQRMERKCGRRGYECVQVLDCEISERQWQEAGAKIQKLNLV